MGAFDRGSYGKYFCNAEGSIVENLVKPAAEIGSKTSETTGKLKFTPEQLQRFKEGREIETEQLAKNGLDKNTKPIRLQDPKTGKEGETIPDSYNTQGENAGGTVEVKNVQRQGLTRQLRLQEKYSNDQGVSPELIINKGAKLSKPLQNSSYKITQYSILPPVEPVLKDGIIQGLPAPGSIGPAPKPEVKIPCGVCACRVNCS